MSSSLEAKDKIVLNIVPGGPPGRVSLDPTDSAELADLFARANPGDVFTGTFKASLDEAGQKNISLSIIDFSVDKPDDQADNPLADIDPDKDAEEDENQPESAAVTLMKNEDGVPEGTKDGDNIPGDILPTH